MCCIFCISDFHSLFFTLFYFFLHLICLSRAKYGISSLTLCLANYNDEKKTKQTEREGCFFWCERESVGEEQWVHLWYLDETFQNSKWESVFCHSFWYPLQTPADRARSEGKKEIADMIDNFQVWVCRFDLKLLINTFSGLSSKLFLLQFDSFLISKFQGNQGARYCLNGLRNLFLTIYIFDSLTCSRWFQHTNPKLLSFPRTLR